MKLKKSPQNMVRYADLKQSIFLKLLHLQMAPKDILIRSVPLSNLNFRATFRLKLKQLFYT